MRDVAYLGLAVQTGAMKPLRWVGRSKEDLKRFPAEARRAAGFQLDRLQHGEEPNDWKPMPGIGAGVCEIRVRDATGAYRVVYLARRPEAVYVLHAFQKKSQRTNLGDVRLARERFKLIPE